MQDDSGVVKLQGATIYWQSYGDNLQRVLTLSDNEQFQQIVKKVCWMTSTMCSLISRMNFIVAVYWFLNRLNFYHR